MKKVILLAFIFIAGTLTSIAGDTAGARWVWWPGLPKDASRQNTNFRFGLVSGGSGKVYVWDCGIFAGVTEKSNGIQTSIFCNNSKSSSVQMTLGANVSDEGRAQLGLVNIGIKIGGVQIGLVNYASDESFQIGLINIISSKSSKYRVLPLINFN